jgi:hypothetical protein
MVLYFFHIRDGETLEQDLEGSEFETLELAMADARLAAREIMADKVMAGYEPDGQSFEIADAEGQIRATVPFRSAIKPGG